MKMRILTIALCLMIVRVGHSQQAAQFSQYTFNKLNFNPGLVGAYDALTITGIYRHQWFGIEGAPRTGLLNVVAPLTRFNTVLGLSTGYDQIGMTRTGHATATYSYIIKFKNGLQVSPGISGTIEYGQVDWTLANPANQNDNMLGEGNGNKWSPNFGLGVAMNTRSWYLGVSLPRILKYHLFRGENDEYKSYQYRELYVMGGVDIGLGRMVRFRPGILMTYNPSAPFDFGLDGSFLLMNQFIVGAAYRLDDALSAFVQYRISPEWKIGFAYDFTVSKLNTHSNGTAEILLEYSLDKMLSGTRNLRFF